jgi:hypothetical protein
MTQSTTTILLLLMGLLCACNAGPTRAPATSLPGATDAQPQVLTQAPTDNLAPDSTPSLTPTTMPTLGPDEWKSMPVVPVGVSTQMIEVYQRGLERGRDPNRFSKFGDCQNILPYYLGMFDSGDYRLGDAYAYLQPTIDHFAGSWGRDSFAVKSGLNVAAVQTLYWTDPENCGADKSPMACEVEKFNPSIVIISFETWWADKPAGDYELRMRSLVDYLLSQDIVPILGTKADNMEGDYGINAAIARVAYDYGLPLWNFWGATYPLEGHGVVTDGFHLTGFGTRAYFDDPARMEMAWPWRNLTALQAIDAVYRSLNNLP